MVFNICYIYIKSRPDTRHGKAVCNRVRTSYLKLRYLDPQIFQSFHSKNTSFTTLGGNFSKEVCDSKILRYVIFYIRYIVSCCLNICLFNWFKGGVKVEDMYTHVHTASGSMMTHVVLASPLSSQSASCSSVQLSDGKQDT